MLRNVGVRERGPDLELNGISSLRSSENDTFICLRRPEPERSEAMGGEEV